MLGEKVLVPLILTAFVVISSGCISMDATAFAKTIPMVQEFLNEYPNADISIVHYTETESEGILDLVKEDCGKLSIEAKEYYFINITDPSSGLIIRAWIDWESQIVECVFKEGILVDPEKCESKKRAACFGDHVFWFDSCDNREDKKEYCPLGCSNGKCIPGRKCELEKSYTEKPECTCPDGHEMMVLYPRCTDSITGAITGMPFAVTETTASKAVTSESGKLMISPEFTTKFEERCPDSKPVYRCVKRAECKSRSQSMCYRGHVFWFDSCGHVQEKKQYCDNGCEKGFCKEANECEAMGGHCVYQPTLAEPVEGDSTYTSAVVSCKEGYKASNYWCSKDGTCCIPEETECTDSDGGKDYYVKGSIDYRKYEEGSLKATSNPDDMCLSDDENTLRESRMDQDNLNRCY